MIHRSNWVEALARYRSNGSELPLPSNSGLPELGILNLSKSDISDFDRERVGVRGHGLSSGPNPSPGSRRTMLRIAGAIRPLPQGERCTEHAARAIPNSQGRL